LADLFGGLLAFGARRPSGASRAIAFGAQHHDCAHFVAWLQPIQPEAELPTDLWVNVA
jgi:hypothetical protein